MGNMATGVGRKQNTRNAPPDKRQSIVAAAQELFTSVGYEQTTIADVAKMAGIAVGTVYLYFKNKRELLLAAREDWETEFIEYMAQPEIQEIPHYMRARPLIEAVFRLCRERTEMIQLMGIPPELIGEMYHKEGNRIREALKLFLDEGVQLGVFRPVDTSKAALITFGMVDSTLEQCFYVDGGRNEQAYMDALVDALEHYLATDQVLLELERGLEKKRI